MKKKLLAAAVALLIAGGAALYLVRPRFPKTCPYGHSDLERNLQKVSFMGKPSRWTLFKLKYVNPPDKYMHCRECGWSIYLDGQCFRESKDPDSFIPPIPAFTVFDCPEMHFTYYRAMKHGDIVVDSVWIDGPFEKEVDDHILDSFREDGIGPFTATTYDDRPVLRTTHEGYEIRIHYTPRNKTCPRRFDSIRVVYPGQDEKSVDP